MMCHIFTGPLNYSLEAYKNISHGDFIIGADQGAKYLADSQFKMDLAIGDFDSVSDADIITISQYATEVITYPVRKDYTDTQLAIQEAHNRGYHSITIYGGMGHRFDHSYANMILLTLGDITIVNDSTKMYVLHPGTYDIENEFPYISFFALQEVQELTVKGFLYELENILLKPLDPLCISNQGSGKVSFTAGLLLVIHQRDNK